MQSRAFGKINKLHCAHGSKFSPVKALILYIGCCLCMKCITIYLLNIDSNDAKICQTQLYTKVRKKV